MDFKLIIELIGVGIGLVYLYFEYKASVCLWYIGMLMSVFYVIIFYQAKFYADAGIYLYYLGANIYGLWIWLKHKKQKNLPNEITQKEEELPMSQTPSKKIIPLSLIGIAIWVFSWSLLKHLTDSPVPIGDSFTTAVSIIAMYLMAHKHIEHWWLWVVVNATSAFLYAWKGLYPMSGLFAVYTIVSIFGYYRWKRQIVVNR